MKVEYSLMLLLSIAIALAFIYFGKATSEICKTACLHCQEKGN